MGERGNYMACAHVKMYGAVHFVACKVYLIRKVFKMSLNSSRSLDFRKKLPNKKDLREVNFYPGKFS